MYTWDTDGHPVTLDSDSLTYDALGREVEVFKGGAYTEFVFGPTGKLALMSGQTQTKAFAPLPGGTQVKYAGSAISTYRLPDWLGSFRVGSNPNRTYSWGVAFAPFGEQYAISGGPALSFTGEEGTADTVSDEYDFLARKLHSAQGRWISPDPAGLSAADPSNPQSWNRYAYALNNPLRFVDPSGLYCQWADGTRDDDPSDGGATYEECVGDPNNEGTWIDTTSITVDGDKPDDVGITMENGEQVFPDTLPLQPTFANCVKNGANYFSLQNGLKTVTNGKLGTGPISGALLGNTGSDLIGLFQGDVGGFLTGKGIEKAIPAGVKGSAAIVPDIAVSSTTTTTAVVQTGTSTTIVRSIDTATTMLPTGTIARAGAELLTEGLESFSLLLKAPIDITALNFSAMVCSIGR